MNNTSAFTMIELIFILIIIGILSAIAVPKLGSSIEDAQYAKGQNDIATIRSSIATKRSENILAGRGAKYPELESSNSALFSNILNYPIYAKNENGHWQMIDSTHYTYMVENIPIVFIYNMQTGSFDCDHKHTNKAMQKACKSLTE